MCLLVEQFLDKLAMFKHAASVEVWMWQYSLQQDKELQHYYLLSISIDAVLFPCFFLITHEVRGLIGALWPLGDILAAHIAEYFQESIDLHRSWYPLLSILSQCQFEWSCEMQAQCAVIEKKKAACIYWSLVPQLWPIRHRQDRVSIYKSFLSSKTVVHLYSDSVSGPHSCKLLFCVYV